MNTVNTGLIMPLLQYFM